MPKSIKKKTPAKTKAKTVSHKKAASKPTVAKKAKAAPAKMVAKQKAAVPPHMKTGFMWKLLEQKEAKAKQQMEQKQNHFHDEGKTDLHPRDQSFSKFSGPRRRAV